MDRRHVKIGNIEVPKDYFELDEISKKVICIEMMDNMLRLIDKHLRPGVNPIDFLDQILESSIQNNIMNEEYEICQVLHDIKNLLDE